MSLERRETEDCQELREQPEEREIQALAVLPVLWVLLVLPVSPELWDRKVLRDRLVLQVRRETQESLDLLDLQARPQM